MPESDSTTNESLLKATGRDQQARYDNLSAPIVIAKDGAIKADSRDIAKAFGKQHKDVLRAIGKLIEQEPDLTPAQFCAGVYTLPATAGQEHRRFEMDRDGFALLAMGFTGAKALKWKLAYIDAFNRMEQALIAGHGGNLVRLDERGMSAIGGMLKGIITKWEREKLPQLVDAAVMNTQVAVSRGMTAGEVVEAAGITNRKGLGGLPRRVSNHLRRFFSERGAPTPLGRLGSTTAYVFDAALVREWLTSGGKQFIQRIVEEKRGQGSLKLVTKA